MIDYAVFVEAVNKLPLVTWKASHTKAVARCIFCGDSKKSQKKKRLNIDYNNGEPIYHCFNCGEGKGKSFVTLYAEINRISIEQAKSELFKYDAGTIKTRLTKPVIRTTDSIFSSDYKNFNWIKKYSVDEKRKNVGIVEKKYIKILEDFRSSRKIDKSFELFVCHSGKFANRIIIPILKRGDIVYFQGRRINNKMQPKYLNPETKKSNIIVNFEKFKKNQTIVIVEGLLDVASINNIGTCCLGKHISDEFLEQLFNVSENIIVALDNDKDGKKQQQEIFLKSKFNKRLKYFTMPYENIKDMNELIINKNINNIENFIRDNSVSHLKYSMSKL